MVMPSILSQSSRDDPGTDSQVLIKTRRKVSKPPLYKVLLLNDDYTPMDFVVHVLELLFRMTRDQAVALMLTVHQKGLAVIGVYSREIAETKVAQVMEYARQHGHPLQCRMEKED